jgi:hypothetical protein
MYSPDEGPFRGRGERPARDWEPEGGGGGTHATRVKRRVTLRFDGFGWKSLESEAERQGETIDESLTRAIAYFGSMLPTTRPAVRAPRFKPRDQGTPHEVALELTGECWEKLEEETERQGILLEQLLEHAAMLHLSDAESGRVADQVLGRAGEEESGPGDGTSRVS